MLSRVFCLGALLVALLLSCLTVVHAAPPPDLKTALKTLGSDDRSTVLDAVEALRALGDGAALPALQALRDDTLRASADGRLFILSADGKQLREFPGGQTVAADSVTVISPAMNNAVRRTVMEVIAQLQVSAPDAAVRLRAATELAKTAGEAQGPLIRNALAKERDPDVKAALALALARVEINGADQAKRLEAVDILATYGNLDTESDLQALLGKKDDGTFLEADPKIRDAATAAIARIEQRQQWVALGANLIYGLSQGSVLLLAAMGLAITFGLMGVINMAHGEMLMLGAYTAYVTQNLFRALLPQYFNFYLAAGLPAAFIVCALVGIVLERAILRFLYGRPLETLLATWGISLVLIQTVRVIFGAQNVQVENPSWLSGGYPLASGLVVPYSRIAVVVLVCAVVALVWYLLQHTNLGLQVRAVTQNRPMAASLGVRTRLVDMWTFG
ncbi:MAG TPA: urea ABC transporter permease subunit UrtB, partial [bacterium]|nr:urea ABC transporter permease subunit UrtB [bacterium]